MQFTGYYVASDKMQQRYTSNYAVIWFLFIWGIQRGLIYLKKILVLKGDLEILFWKVCYALEWCADLYGAYCPSLWSSVRQIYLR